MSALAVVIGIDDYRFKPLTTAANDAAIFRDTLVSLDLITFADVIFLTSPVRTDSDRASRSAINASLKEAYDRGAPLDRLFFYFAGHGLSAWTTASRSSVSTALVPPEVEDLESDANLLLNFDDLRSRMELAGPTEQYYFVDACRDFAFDERPGDLPGLGWPASREPRNDPSAQAVLYAVAPGGKALGVREGMGVMTSHLVGALNGRGVALDWSDDDDRYVVTAESIARHVRDQVRTLIGGLAFWRHSYMIPDFRPTGPSLLPLRIIESPPRPTFHLDFEPPSSADATRVHLRLRGQQLQEPSWPPRMPGEHVLLEPQVYRIDAETDLGTATADPVKLDARRVQSAIVRVVAGPAPVPATVGVDPGPGDVQVQSQMSPNLHAVVGSIDAEADEAQAIIEVSQQAPPYRRWHASAATVGPWAPADFRDVWHPRGPRLIVEVPPGSYEIRFRLGSEVYSEGEIDVVAGETKTVTPGGARSSAIGEAVLPAPDGAVVLSETIGPMRTSALLTALPIVGVLPFDANRELFSRFRSSLSPQIESVDAAAYDQTPLRVVVAVDGNGWPIPVSDVAAGVHCEVHVRGEAATELQLHPLATGTGGWARLAHATVTAPARSFVARFRSPVFGEIDVAGASLPNRVTVIGLAVKPDGDLDAVQHLMRIPGRPYPFELDPQVSYGRALRDLILGQRLYESQDLIENGAVPNAQVLRDLLFAKWTDPILGCMAYYAWNDAAARGVPEAQGVAPTNTIITAQNLLSHFPELADAKIIGALAGLLSVPSADSLLKAGELPVLSRSVREATRAMPHLDEMDQWASRIAPANPWTLVWRSPASVGAPPVELNH